MTNSPQLVLAYIAKSPESASRILSSMPPDAAAAFMGEIPTLNAVQLVTHLQAASAARIMRAVDGNVAAAIFRDLDFGKSSAVVRQMDRATRNQFLGKLSERTRVGLEKSLSFAPGTVGASMTTTIATLSETDTVATALDTIRQSDRDHIDVVFVLSDGGRLVGVVSSTAALRHPGVATLSTILDTSCRTVSAHSNLQAIVDPALWDDFAYLPVANRQHQVIGAIARKMLTSARLADATAAHLSSQSMATSIFAALATSAEGLSKLVSSSLAESVRRGESNDR